MLLSSPQPSYTHRSFTSAHKRQISAIILVFQNSHDLDLVSQVPAEGKLGARNCWIGIYSSFRAESSVIRRQRLRRSKREA